MPSLAQVLYKQIFISDLYHGTSFLNYNRAVGVNYISLSQHELFVQFIRVLLCMLFNIFAVGAAMFLVFFESWNYSKVKDFAKAQAIRRNISCYHAK